MKSWLIQGLLAVLGVLLLIDGKETASAVYTAAAFVVWALREDTR